MSDTVSIFWFRRDLRLHDNVALYNALQSGYPVLPIFIFDTAILERLPKDDARVSFIHGQLQKINAEIQSQFQSGLALYMGYPLDVFKQLSTKFNLHSVHTNRDYEPYGIKRDSAVKNFLSEKNIAFNTYKDHVIFEQDEIVKDDGNPYAIYTPYKNKWKQYFDSSTALTNYDTYPYFKHLYGGSELPNLKLQHVGFEPSKIKIPDYSASPDLIQNYEDKRNFPAIEYGTSRLGPHLRFGTVSIRKMIAKAFEEENEVFWNELIWREFFMQILWHYPKTINQSFKPKYDFITWRNNEAEFQLWKAGKTGYPLVDAGMRELKETGYMHNRVRMLAASFLCKHLLIDWRWGEAYFAEKLLDFDLSSNVGNWQWAAGSGVDAAPYFRIFNPTTQMEKFDKDQKYITKWVPELQELTYPTPIVDHKFARERCLKVYKEAVG
ncbi:MAG: deoxyribodipyrimidine photo-lyase [Flavobacteriaceae bacterium]